MTIQEEPKPSITISSLAISPKREGKFEKEIIDKVALFFREKGYETKEHVSMNLAWGNVLSEIDVIAIRNEEIVIIEVKSKRDKINRAKKQLDKIRIFADYCFIASDIAVEPTRFADDTGILLLQEGKTTIARDAIKIGDQVSRNFLLCFKKRHLNELGKEFGSKQSMSKKELTSFLVEKVGPNDLRRKVRSIAFSKLLN
jgi:hypothetical protein